MKTSGDIWEDIGSLSEDEMLHVITKLFACYEEQLSQKPNDAEALNFFNNLANSIDQTTACNSNRR